VAVVAMAKPDINFSFFEGRKMLMIYPINGIMISD